MKELNIFSVKTTVNISVVKIDNQKINKTIFNQLLYSSLFDKTFKLKDNVKVLGFVNDKEKYILWGDGKSLFKCKLASIRRFAHFDLENGKFNDFFELYSKKDIEYFNRSSYDREEYERWIETTTGVSFFLNEVEKQDIQCKQDFVKEVIHELNQRQVFL